MAKVEINIDEYLSEEDKKQLAIDVFKDSVRNELFKSHNGTVQSESEIQRYVSNISFDIVMKYVQEFIPDLEIAVKEKVKKTLIEDNLSFYLFKKKDAWERKESLAVTFMDEAVRESKIVFKDKVKNDIVNFDTTKIIREEISNTFEDMAGNLSKMADLFLNEPIDNYR